MNVVRDALGRFKRPVHMVSKLSLRSYLCLSDLVLMVQVIGGLHLASPDLLDRIEPTVDFLANKMRPAPTYVLPMHCSGFGAKVALQHALGEGCVPAGTGMRVEVVGDGKAEKRMFAPTIN